GETHRITYNRQFIVFASIYNVLHVAAHFILMHPVPPKVSPKVSPINRAKSMGQLTDSRARTARTAGADLFLSDGKGLYLRVRSSGTKLWLYRYKADGRTRWFEIGTYPSIGLADARLKAAEITAKRRQGFDPLEER